MIVDSHFDLLREGGEGGGGGGGVWREILLWVNMHTYHLQNFSVIMVNANNG